MSLRLVISLSVLILCGCKTPPAGAPKELGDGLRREGHSAFTPEEQATVEQFCHRRIDAYYRVTHAGDEYRVLVLEVHRYVGKEPMFTIGRDWGVILNNNGTVTHVSPPGI
jgi:hypothetical protein